MDLFNNVYKGKKVLLTGDSGFKGSWMCIWLLELGAEVYGYSLPPLSEADNFVTTGLKNKIKHIDADVRDKNKLADFFNTVKPDFAFHLAAQPLVIDSYTNPHYNFETNLMGTVNFFEAVRNCPSVKVAVNVTTDKSYQNNEWVWGYRENDPMGGDDPYSASKGCSELITHSYLKSFFSKEGTCHIASGRAGNVIGGGDWAENRILPDIMRACKNKTATEIRNPNSVRPWQHVLEPLSGYLLLGEKLFNGGKKYSGGWNFGPAAYENYTVGDVVDQVKKNIPGIEIKSPLQTEKLHEAGLLKLDITKAVNVLGWKPKLNFEQTIQMTTTGYLTDMQGGNNIYKARVEQISKYCNS
ncbi:MAG: CDP-glucose 4,6-dehydratase [Sphingobacteriaceae bacterium]|nr:CDP-glucose 4,6-dehydratase [Sphingobacteriaceae bacterium]